MPQGVRVQIPPRTPKERKGVVGKDSGISWTHNTFNGWIGCTKVSPGCKFCYAEKWDERFGGGHWGPGAPRRLTKDANWKQPVKWNAEATKTGERQRVFCSSLADVFDAEVPDEWRERLWKLIGMTPMLDWLVLTKRPENAKDMLPDDWDNGYANVWMGTTTEDQERADERIDILAGIPAVVRWLSVEPQIGRIDFSKWLSMETVPFDWLIFGGESGNEAGVRVFDPEWIREPMALAKSRGVSRFVKQMGTVWAKNGKKDGKGGDPAEWDEWLRVAEFPMPRILA